MTPRGSDFLHELASVPAGSGSALRDFPKRYDFREVEPKWQAKWEEWGIYRFDGEDRERPTFSINTPPPYPSGEFHVGNALNHAYIDFVARYKRMRGYNVLFPQGWDCHGLPTEVRVERTTGRSKREFDPEEFIRLCREYTLKWIEPMRRAIRALGCSIDWSTEYKTMDPDYWRRTQLSFVLMYRRGLVYRAKHPVTWCPRCETAIAEAEVEYRTVVRPLYYLNFSLEGGGALTVASTRPELLAACVAVAVHPEDGRYRHLVGGRARVPIYGRWVPIIAEEEVDPRFGTGAVMVCTYGDKSDVRWQKRHGLPVIEAIDERGRMTEVAGPLRGLRVDEARERVVELLRERGLLVRVERVVSGVGTCWRCHTPVEIIPREQWFVKTRELAPRVLEEASRIKWVPPHMRRRLEDWVRSLDWDWPISRQRLFATPIPVWYCRDCGHVIVAEPEWLPIDPRRDPLPTGRCPRCGSANVEGERDVMDTWMDSSITAAVHAGWPDAMDERLFPADLQPNGYDIIRTWDYYLIVRGVALFGRAQFKVALINGMVRGTDGRMMHKSYGNYVSLMEVLERYGADAFRLWAALSASTGSDVRFSWESVKYARRFLTKLWNAARFVASSIGDFDPSAGVPESEYRLTDRWILALLERLTAEVTEALEEYDFMGAASRLVDFTWHRFCDHYVEAVKYRVSGGGPGRRAAQRTLYTVLLRVLQMLSVFTPHICEELYHRIFARHEGWLSITVAPWPEAGRYDESCIEQGGVLMGAIAAARRAKRDARVPLSARVSEVVVYAGEYAELLERWAQDIAGTLRASRVTVRREGRGTHPVEGLPSVSVEVVP